MKNLIHEIHRRSLWQVLGIYVAGSWVALQVVNEVVDSVALPEWISGAAVVLLIVGFPIVLGTAFVQEGMGSGSNAGGVSDRTAGVDAASPSDGDATGSAQAVTTPHSESGGHRRLFTWRNAIAGGVVAFALLGVATAAFIVMRTAGIGAAGTLVAKGFLEERDRILLADFSNRTDDELLAGVVTEALRVDLAQSDAVRLAEQSVIAGALARMERSPDTPIDPTLARLLAQREGIKAVLTGEIGAVGSSYVLTAQVLEPAEGEVLLSHREDAGGEDEIIDAINRLSRRLRERIGEPLGSLRTTPPLERVTTSNLEALRLYTQAVRAIEFDGDDARGIALLEEAIAIDSAFAAAYRKLGVTLGNRFEERDRYIEALSQAYEHRERLTSSERYMAIASYESTVTGDMAAAMAAYENLLESDPDYYPALNNLGVLNNVQGNIARAEELYLKAATVDRSSPFPWANVVWPQVERGGFEDAHASLDSIQVHFPGFPVPELRGKLHAIQGDYDAADSEWLGLLEMRSGDPYYESMINELLGMSAATRGQLALADERFDRMEAADRSRALPGAALEAGLLRGWIDLLVRRDTAAAAEGLRDALSLDDPDDLAPHDRPYLELVDLHASLGELEQARDFLARFEAEVPENQRGRGVDLALLRSRAAILIAEGSYAEALGLVRQAGEVGCRPCGLPLSAEAFEAAGMPDSAIAVYERYVDMTWLDRVYFDTTDLPRFLERLGQLYDQQGEPRKAAEYYARFVDLWADADEELQPRVRAARARLDEILQEIG